MFYCFLKALFSMKVRSHMRKYKRLFRHPPVQPCLYCRICVFHRREQPQCSCTRHTAERQQLSAHKSTLTVLVIFRQVFYHIFQIIHFFLHSVVTLYPPVFFKSIEKLGHFTAHILSFIETLPFLAFTFFEIRIGCTATL